MRDYPDILLRKNFYSLEECTSLYEYLLNTCKFQEKQNIVSATENMPRLIHWFGPYHYYYSEIKNPACEMPSELKDIAFDIGVYLALQGVSAKFNSVLINYYRDGRDKIGMHSDDVSQLETHPVIASLSLGDSRTFKMQHTTSKEKHNLLLENGDLFVMKGKTQNDWKHGISPEGDKGIRINLTFRNIIREPQ